MKESRWASKAVLWAFLAGAGFWGCVQEPAESIEQKLRFILEDDLAVMVSEIAAKDSTALLDKPYYRIEKYEHFPESRLYNVQAVVHYYYLKHIKMIQVRKYRYGPSNMQWERYYKKLDYNL